VRYALQHSINVPAVRLAIQTGIENVATLLEQLGLGTDVPAFPSLALGSISTTPMDMCLAYALFANHGYEPSAPISIKAITDMQNNIVYKADLGFKTEGSPQGSYIVDNILLGNATEGTATGLRRFHIAGEYAGKTGTTNDFRDVWFVGYTPDIVAVDWLGYDEQKTIGSPAAQIALPIAGRFLEKYTGMYGGRAFEVPSGIKFACVDRYTGAAGQGVTDCVQGAFIEGTEPKQGTINSVIDWFRRLLHK
jgi:penicillin-binding protein 1B